MQKDFKIANFIIKPSQSVICGIAGDKKVEPKVMDLLLVLANANGEIVSRDKIFEALWKDQSASDYALNTLIATLRKNFDDNAQSPKYIETRAKLGYRLIPKIETTQQIKKQSSISDHKHTVSRSQKLWKPILIIIVLVVFSIIAVNLFKGKSTENEAPLRLSNDDAKTENKVSNRPHQQNSLQYKYISKVNISVTSSEHNEAGIPICVDTEADFLTKLVFANKKWALKDFKWTLYSDFFDLKLDYNQETLTNISEQHEIEYGHPYGTVKNKLSISFDEMENFTGSSIWTVYGYKDEVLCVGSSLFIAKKL